MSFAKVYVLKNEDFEKFAKVLSIKFLPKVELAKLKFTKVREFIVSRNFLPAKPSSLEVISTTLGGT